ncbi:hypothetical protein BUALT_Bualt18G0011800 [Buddleja alternifolia]|uniref:GRF-type domain-containing protein n=1 Tax=Buddleja alternifolia TaxID=168488 RepID=A0AAV6WB25_9LAMI|nr:hypothetical protein BUALT_Bualt18G0011800 [Buddleja alternifolia]
MHWIEIERKNKKLSSSSCSSSSLGVRICDCKKRAPLGTSWTDDNLGRRFHGCENFNKIGGCNFFKWADPPMCPRAMVIIPNLRRDKHRLTVENEQLRQRISAMEEENAKLSRKISSLLDENMNMGRIIANMGSENANLRRRVSIIESDNDNLGRKIASMEFEDENIGSKISKLEDCNTSLTRINKIMKFVLVVSWLVLLLIWCA